MTITSDRRGPTTPQKYVDKIDEDVAKEIAKIRRGEGVVAAPKREPRCRVCQYDDSRLMVNKLLANAVPIPEILQVVEASVNPNRPKKARITYQSLYYHSKRHFNLDEPAKARYRDILERRAVEQSAMTQAEGVLAEQGVVRLMTALGYLDVMAHKGYQTLVSEDVVISPALGMEAVVRLHEMTRRDMGSKQIAELRQQLAVIQSAVREVVPQEYWAEIVARIEEAESRTADNIVDVEVVEDEDDDEPFDPIIEADIDDSIED